MITKKGKRLATISSVAKEAKVSKTTVSRVLNHPQLVNQETKDKVNEVIKKQNFTPSYLAQGMRKQQTKTIGVLIPEFANLYYADLLAQMETEAYNRGYTAIISAYGMDPEIGKKNILQFANRQQIEGIVLPWYLSLKGHKTFFNQLSKILPVILMDQGSPALPFSSVRSNSYNGLRKLTRYIINKGHKEIIFIAGLKKYTIVGDRLRGFLDEMRENGLDPNEDYIEECDFTIAGGHTACNRILDRKKPTAIMCVNDVIAIGALMAVYERGYKVPADIAISGYDNMPIAGDFYPPLTTVEEPIKKKVTAALELIIQKIEKKYSKNKHIVFDVDIIERASV